MVHAVCGSAEADFIRPDSVIASSSDGIENDPIHTINGSGLPLNFTVADSHAAYNEEIGQGNHWTTAPGTIPGTEWIEWRFNDSQTLDRIYLWNHQSEDGYAVRDFDLTFFNEAGDPITTKSLAFDEFDNLAQTFFFSEGPIEDVLRVRFDVNSILVDSTDEGFNRTGLAEVAFETFEDEVEAVPEPASFAFLTLASLGGLGLRYRRKRTANEN
jgi:hypothetical protein